MDDRLSFFHPPVLKSHHQRGRDKGTDQKATSPMMGFSIQSSLSENTANGDDDDSSGVFHGREEEDGETHFNSYSYSSPPLNPPYPPKKYSASEQRANF